jgi:hypothetical protein
MSDRSDLLERYLYAIGKCLSARRAEDTVAELRANLLAQIDDRAEETGKPLTEAEVVSVLKEHGPPMLVAARYLPQRSLIGPTIFPYYWFTLRRGLPLVAIVYAIVQCAVALSGGPAAAQLGAALLRFPSVAITFWAVVTIVFAACEFALGANPAWGRWRNNWDPTQLPAAKQREKSPPLAHRVADVIVGGLFLLWVLAVPRKPYLLLGPGVRNLHSLPVGLTPEWPIFYYQIVTLLLLQLALKVVALFHWSSLWQQVLALGIQTAGVVLLAIVVQARIWFVPVASGSFAENIASLNYGVSLSLKIALAISVAKLLWDVGKLLKGVGRPGALVLQ